MCLSLHICIHVYTYAYAHIFVYAFVNIRTHHPCIPYQSPVSSKTCSIRTTREWGFLLGGATFLVCEAQPVPSTWQFCAGSVVVLLTTNAQECPVPTRLPPSYRSGRGQVAVGLRLGAFSMWILWPRRAPAVGGALLYGICT